MEKSERFDGESRFVNMEGFLRRGGEDLIERETA